MFFFFFFERYALRISRSFGLAGRGHEGRVRFSFFTQGLDARKVLTQTETDKTNRTRRGFHVGNAVKYFGRTRQVFDGVKEWSGAFFDTHQLGVRLNLMLTSKAPT